MSHINEKTGRDLALFTNQFASWLSQRFPASDAEVVRVDHVKDNGFSSETLLVDIRSEDPALANGLVVRLPPPPNFGLFPNYDLEHQARVQVFLAARGVRTAKPIAYESSSDWVGSRFLVMERIVGRSLPDHPSYSVEGWVKELSAQGQERILSGFFEQLAKLHSLPASDPEVRQIAERPDAKGTPLQDEFDWWMNYLEWEADDAPAREVQKVRDVLNWCADHWPNTIPDAGLIWGDARPGNILYDDNQEVAAVLDFETVALGPAELDLGWWMSSRFSMCGTLPELPGFLGRDESLDAYSRMLGRPLLNVRWYEVLGAARTACCVCGMQAIRRRRGLPLFELDPIAPWVVETMRVYRGH